MVPEVEEVGYLQRAKTALEGVYISTAMAITSMVLANTVDRSDFVVYAHDDLPTHVKRSATSAFVAPSLGDYGRTVNVGGQIIETVVSAQCARKTTGAIGLFGTAAAAELASCGADDLAKGLLTPDELKQEDVGFSAINVAWITKFLFDKARASKDHARRWWAGAATFAGAVVVGLPAYEGSQGGKLEAVSHATGLGVGILAHIASRRKKIPLDNSELVTKTGVSSK